MIVVENLVKTFGGFRAVDNASLRIEEGTITGLIGPNGAGKTTLFNVIAGVLKPTSGRVTMMGEDITGLPPHTLFHKGLLRTFQIAHEFSSMTVRENLMMVPADQSGERLWNTWFGRKRIADEERALRAKADEVIEFLTIDHLFIGLDFFQGPFGQHVPLCHADDGVAKAADKVHVMLNDHESIVPFLVQADYRVSDRVEQGAVHACTNLIQKDDFGIHHHRAPEFQQLLLTAGQVACLLFLQMINCEELDHLVGLGAQRAFLVCDPFAAEPSVPQPLARLIGWDHHQVFTNCHRRKLMGDLECAQQPLVKQRVRRQTSNVFAHHGDTP